MENSAKKAGRPGRIITIENYALVIEYFARDKFQAISDGSVRLRSLASQYKHTYRVLKSPETAAKQLSSLEELLAHHIQNKSPIETIKRFEDRLAWARNWIPISESMLEELQILTKTLEADEWRRCSDWMKQKRKRAADKSTDAEKRTIKVSTSVFDQLTLAKDSLPEATWDDLFTYVAAQNRTLS